DARSLFLTPNSTVVYVFACIDLKDGPMVMQVPPKVLGPVDDAYFRWVTDVGLTGPDQGKGGKYLFVPPGYSASVPSDGYFVAKSRTNLNIIFSAHSWKTVTFRPQFATLRQMHAYIRYRRRRTRPLQRSSIRRDCSSTRSAQTPSI